MDINKELFKYCAYYPVVWGRGQRVPSYLRKLMRSQYLSQCELPSLQAAKLKQLLQYAKASVPFYERTLGKISDDIIRSVEDLQGLPFLTKSDLKSNQKDLLARERFHFLTRKTTGGSTGEPVTIPKTRNAMAWELAAAWRGYSWAGIDIGDRQGRFWGVPFEAKGQARARVIDFIANRKRCSAFAFTEQDLHDYTIMLQKFRPTYFYGYVSMIEEYAKYFLRAGVAPPFDLKCIITTSEVLTASKRQLIANTFSTRVFNEYGSGELGSVAHECEHGMLHVSAENMVVEVMDGNRPCNFGEVGELVITELNNLAAPLIRYRTGDFASLSGSQCKCRRTLPIIENLFGRAYDTIRNQEGRLFHGEFMMYIFEDSQRRNLGILAFQVIQADFLAFRIKVVPDKQYGKASEEFISRRIREYFDPRAVVTFELVSKIERAPSGKMRLIVGMAV